MYINSKQSSSNKFYVQIPYMRSPYGLSAFTDDTTERTIIRWTCRLTPITKKRSSFERNSVFDDMIVDAVAQNSTEWLGKEFSADVLRQALFKPSVRPGKGDYPATLKLKVMCNPDGSFVPWCYTTKESASHSIKSKRVKRSSPSVISIKFGSSIPNLVSPSG